MFYFVDKCELYNYADDNTLSYASSDPDDLKSTLQAESKVLIDWFNFNCMKANPDKFQAIAIGKKSRSGCPVFKIDSFDINCDESVKLLGIDIDFKLNFDLHIGNICKRAAQQLNILKRIGKNLGRLS